MIWIRERVWQMGIGGLLVLLGAWLTYTSSAGEVIRGGWMWVGLGLIFFGLSIPLAARLIEAAQEKMGEYGEC